MAQNTRLEMCHGPAGSPEGWRGTGNSFPNHNKTGSSGWDWDDCLSIGERAKTLGSIQDMALSGVVEGCPCARVLVAWVESTCSAAKDCGFLAISTLDGLFA